MKRIEIITPQNVPLEYKLATFQSRMLAFFLDVLVMVVLVFLLFLAVSVFDLSNRNERLVSFIFLFPLLFFYSLAWELFSQGISPGKKVMKLRIIKITGEPLQLSDLLIRWAFRWIDIWGSLGSVAAFQISSSERGQRIGDLLADTTVISESSRLIVRLKELKALNKSSEEQPVVYPEVIHLTEQEMLWVRYTLLRYKRFPNQAHQQLIAELAQNLAEKVKSEVPSSRAVTFLEQLLRDFIRVTRS